MNRIACMCLAVGLAVCLGGCAQASEPADAGNPSVSEQAGVSTDANVRSYTVSRIEGEPDWDAIPTAEIDNQQWTAPVDIAAYAQLCYDDEAFYVRMRADEAEIRAEYPQSDLLANTYEDSCLEFFIMPVPGDDRYLNFEFNPNCAVGVQIGAERANRTRLVRTDDVYQAEATRTDGGWEITYRIPFDFIRQFYPGFTAESGLVLRGNFYKCGNLTANKHYLSWNPVDSDTPNFHLPESFGELVLE